MLTPSEIAALGDASERRAASAVDGVVELVAKMVAEAFAAGDESVPSASGVPQAVLAYLAAHPIEKADEVEEEEARAEERSDRNDAAVLGVAVGVLALSALGSRAGSGGGSRRTPDMTGSGADYIEREVRAFLQRSNLAMAADVQATYRRVVAEGIRRYKAGMENYEQAMTRMCREIARAGVSSVRYRSGARVQADVAVRRHVQSMVRKAADERTLDAALRLGYKLVEVSSHGGARPSHRRWQGKVYSLVGDIEIDGVRYRDFWRETGYGSVDGLGGANCRHSFAPYTPGRPRRWVELDEESEDETYKLTQEQRANEREIRAWKREAMACRAAGVDDTDARIGLGRAQKKQREFMARHPELQRRPGREQVYGSDGSTAKVAPLKRKQVSTSDKASKERDERVANDLPNDLNRAAQRKHVKDSKEYDEKAASMRAKGSPYPAPSYLAVSEDEAEELVRRYAGKGTAKARRDGSWNGQEICVADRVVGYIVNKDGSEVPVRGFKIHYSKRGTHIVPFEAFEEMKDA